MVWPHCVDGETKALRRDAPPDPVTHLSGELEHSSDRLSTPFEEGYVTFSGDVPGAPIVDQLRFWGHIF